MSEVFREIDSKGDIESLVRKYHLDREIPCSIRGCHQPHKSGFVARLKDGNHGHIGHVCGKKLLGDAEFVLMKNDLAARQREAALLTIVSSPDFDPAAVLAGVGWDAAAGTAEEAQRVLKSSAPHLFRALRAAPEGRLTVVVQNDNPGQGIRKSRFREEIRHVIAGRRWVTTETLRLRDRLADARGDLRVAAKMLSKTELTASDLETIVGKVGSAERLLLQVAALLEEYRAFTAPANLEGIARWSLEADQREPMRVCPLGLVHDEDGEVIALPRLPPIDTGLLGKLKRDA